MNGQNEAVELAKWQLLCNGVIVETLLDRKAAVASREIHKRVYPSNKWSIHRHIEA